VVERVAALQQAGADHVAISVVSAAPSIHEWRRVAGALLPS
jgi:hypothetical protein